MRAKLYESAKVKEVKMAEMKKLSPEKKKVAIALVVGLGVLACVFWFVKYQIPRNEAVEQFNIAAEGLEERNAELDAEISALRSVLKSKEEPFDPKVAESAGNEIGAAQAAKEDVPEMPAKTEEIAACAASIEKMGTYKDEIDDLRTARISYENSVAQLKQITNPSQQFVLERLTGLPNITGIEAVAEGNDPNGKLGKQGGYTASVIFRSDLVPESELYLSGEYTPIIDAGCDGGGTVEVFATVEDVQERDEYLGAFDGSILTVGSHAVFGTCVVRTSSYLTASQQQAMQQAIVDSLTRL